jgi:hypothetical protein
MPAAAQLKNGNIKSLYLEVQDDKYPFFIELISNLDFVRIEPGGASARLKKERLVANIKKGFADRKSIDNGTLKTYPIEDLFDE